MNLFNKEKDFIHRVVNLILLIWVIITLVICYNGIINVFIKKPLQTYSVYKEQYCNIEECKLGDGTCIVPKPGEETKEEQICKTKYAVHKEERNKDNLRYTKQIISSLLSFITVSTALYLINKEKKVIK